MKQCSNCKTHLKDSVRFCTNCGNTSFEDIPQKVEQQEVDTNNQVPQPQVQYVFKKDTSIIDSIKKIRQKILELLVSNPVTDFLLGWSGLLLCAGPCYELLRNIPKINELYSANFAEWLVPLYGIGFLLSLLDLKHGAFSFLFAVRGIEIFIDEFAKQLRVIDTYSKYTDSLLEVFEHYSLSGETVGNFILYAILFGIAFFNYRKEKSGY